MPSLNTQDERKRLLEAAVVKAGGKAALGRLLGYVDGAFVGQMLRNERPITEKTVETLESKPGFRGWFSASLLASGEDLTPQAQSVSLRLPTVESTEPQTLEWRELMENELPPCFRVQMLDNAMAPQAPEGRWAVFTPATDAEAGKRVLVRDRAGTVYFRRYRQVDIDGHWQAIPDNENFPRLDSVTNGLTIIARMRHIELPDDE